MIKTVCRMIESDPYVFAGWCKALGLHITVTYETTIMDLAREYIAQRQKSGFMIPGRRRSDGEE